MSKYDKSTVQAVNDAYEASGTWRQLADDLGMHESAAAILHAIGQGRNGYSRGMENTIRAALNRAGFRLEPILPRKRNRIDITNLSPAGQAQVMALVNRLRNE